MVRTTVTTADRINVRLREVIGRNFLASEGSMSSLNRE